MSRYSVALDFGAALSAPERCPSCLAGELEASPVGGRLLFRCRTCKKSWHVTLGRLVEDVPATSAEARPATGG